MIMEKALIDIDKIVVGVVGIGLMGSSICTCMLIAGHPVIGLAPIPVDLEAVKLRICNDLDEARREGIITQPTQYYLDHLLLTENYEDLAPCSLVVECTLEDLNIKSGVYQKIEAVIAEDAILTSNTSAIPITLLQQSVKHPGRFFGLHWTIPAFTTRFLEVICGDHSEVSKGEYLCELAKYWSKEPTFVHKDIRGFIANRLMYAMYREACHLVEEGYASVEDVDRACRNNTGYWMTLAGVFRWMDLTGVQAYHAVMKDLLPDLHADPSIPTLIDDIVKAGGKGVANGHGFYTYTPEEARLWEETYKEFSFEIRKLALKYPEDVVKRKLKS